jgi:hypothetical protein
VRPRSSTTYGGEQSLAGLGAAGAAETGLPDFTCEGVAAAELLLTLEAAAAPATSEGCGDGSSTSTIGATLAKGDGCLSSRTGLGAAESWCSTVGRPTVEAMEDS